MEYTLPVTIVERADAQSIIEIFERINSYGRRLSEQEQRQAGLTSNFAQVVRKLSCEIRGDVSEENVPLSLMPEVSVEGVKAVHGFGIKAENTFWSKQGVLHFSSLRDSLDEQVVSDIVACILNKEPVQRSKAQLDSIYNPDSRDYLKFDDLLSKYGEADLTRDFLAVFDRIQLACDCIPAGNLQSVISKGAHHNEISTIFAAVFMAFYELMINRNMEVFNYPGLIEGLSNISLATQRKAIDPVHRRANINNLKGSIQDYFVETDVKDIPLGKPLIYTFQNSLKRSRIELPHYEFKQGFVGLGQNRKFMPAIMEKVIQTICAMANIEPDRDSFIYIGVVDTASDAARIAALDAIQPAVYEGRHIVGIGREASLLQMTLDDYVMKIKDQIVASKITEKLKQDVARKIDCFVYEGYDVLRIVVPGQRAVSFVGNECFIRQGSSTISVPIQAIPDIARNFN